MSQTGNPDKLLLPPGTSVLMAICTPASPHAANSPHKPGPLCVCFHLPFPELGQQIQQSGAAGTEDVLSCLPYPLQLQQQQRRGAARGGLAPAES